MTDDQRKVAHLLAEAFGAHYAQASENSGDSAAAPAQEQYTTDCPDCDIVVNQDWAHSNQRVRARVGRR